MAKRMQHGFAARNGLFAALVSRKSYTGIDKVFERPHGGFLATFGNGSNHQEHYLTNKLTEGLGNAWTGMNGMRVKPYASQISTHAPINCIEALQAQYPEKFTQENLSNIQSITVSLAEAPFAHGGHEISRPMTALGAQMSTRYTVAAQLLDGDVLMDQFNSTNLDRDGLWNLIERTNCVWNREFDKLSNWHTKVTVDFGNGYTISHEVNGPKTYDDKLANEAIREKWTKLTHRVLPDDRRQAVEEMVLNLEKVEDLTELISLLEREVDNPIS